MKRVLSSITFVLMACISAFSQSEQNCVVKEYNDAKKKTPLAGVEVVVNNAGSNVSAKNGKFVLSFRTLKPGDKVEVRRIEKAGYEIFNRDALDAWRIANDGSEFTIVLCKSAKFKALKDQYNAVASKSYAQQQKKDEERLANLLKEGKLLQVEYEQKLKELNDKYDEQLENLDNYIDRFARIDLETISKEEQKIIEMVKAGNIEEAISAYEAMNLEEKYAQTVENIGVATNAISQLEKVKADNENARSEAYDAVKRMNDVRRLQGGEENYKKIGESLKRIAEIDTTQLLPLYDYADFAADQNEVKEALKYYDIILANETNIENRGIALQRYANICVYEDTDKALHVALESEQILDSLIQVGQNVQKNKQRLLTVYNCLANVYNQKRDLNLAEHYYKLSMRLIKERGFNDLRDKTDYTTIACNLGTLYGMNGRHKEAIGCLSEAFDIQSKVIEEARTLDNINILYNCALQLGTAYGRVADMVQCKHFFDIAVAFYQELQDQNPQAFKEKGAILFNNIGSVYLDRGLFIEAETAFSDALKCAEDGFEQNQSLQNKINIIVIRGALGSSIVRIAGREKEGKALIEQSLTEINPLYSRFQDILKPFYIILLQQKSFALVECGEYDAAMNTIEEALNGVPDDANNWDIKGYAYTKMDEWEKAMDCWKKVIELNPDFTSQSLSDLYHALVAKGIISKE